MPTLPLGSKSTKPTNIGFTLFEIIVVVMILGALSAMVLPSFSIQRNQAEEEAYNIQKFIEKYRTLAMESSYPSFLSFDTSKRQVIYTEKTPQDIDENKEGILDKKEDKEDNKPHYTWSRESKLTLSTASQNDLVLEEVEPLIPLYKDGRSIPFILKIHNDDHTVRLVYNGTNALGQIKKDVEQ